MAGDPQHPSHPDVLSTMVCAIDPITPNGRDYVVPMPRITDALGKALDAAFRPPLDVGFSDLLSRLDRVR